MRIVGRALLVLSATAGVARAGGPSLEAGVALARPAALETGLGTGVGAGFMAGGTFGWGVRASWSEATEYTRVRQVTHDDFRLRLVGALQHAAGAGTVALRLGLGGTAVHETRERDQAARAGLTGSALETTAWSVLPAADLEAAVTLRLFGDWGAVVHGGPSAHLLGGDARLGWTAGVDVAWWPW